MEEHNQGQGKVGEESKTSQYGARGGVEQEEIGRDESWFATVRSTYDAWFANIKRTYDEFQQESLESIRHERLHYDKMVSDAQQYDNQRQVIANHALELAVSRDNLATLNTMETTNMTGKQAMRHSDIAIDQEWNPIQQGAGDAITARSVTLDDASLKAIGAAIASALTTALNPKPAA